MLAQFNRIYRDFHKSAEQLWEITNNYHWRNWYKCFEFEMKNNSKVFWEGKYFIGSVRFFICEELEEDPSELRRKFADASNRRILFLPELEDCAGYRRLRAPLIFPVLYFVLVYFLRFIFRWKNWEPVESTTNERMNRRTDSKQSWSWKRSGGASFRAEQRRCGISGTTTTRGNLGGTGVAIYSTAAADVSLTTGGSRL